MLLAVFRRAASASLFTAGAGAGAERQLVVLVLLLFGLLGLHPTTVSASSSLFARWARACSAASLCGSQQALSAFTGGLLLALSLLSLPGTRGSRSSFLSAFAWRWLRLRLAFSFWHLRLSQQLPVGFALAACCACALACSAFPASAASCSSFLSAFALAACAYALACSAFSHCALQQLPCQLSPWRHFALARALAQPSWHLRLSFARLAWSPTLSC